MSIRLFFAPLAVTAAAFFAPAAPAADVYAPPPTGYAAPVNVGSPGCETCQHGAAKGSCTTCKPPLLFPNKYKPYQVNLCPGACFGYFQTQWRKWDEACPYPYTGQGVSDAPRPPVPQVNVPRPGPGELNPPRPLDPMKPMDTKPMDKKPGGGVELPGLPGGKFGP